MSLNDKRVIAIMYELNGRSDVTAMMRLTEIGELDKVLGEVNTFDVVKREAHLHDGRVFRVSSDRSAGRMI
jgi:hypothetical protein